MVGVVDVLQKNPIQEIVDSKIKEVPKKFVYENGYDGDQVDTLPWLDEPAIDLGRLVDDSNPDAQQAEMAKLRYAFTQGCCFQLINHGMTREFLDQVRQTTKNFFYQPHGEKKKVSRGGGIDEWDGYGNDTIFYENQVLDWTDRLYLSLAPDNRIRLDKWPETFKNLIPEYTKKLRALYEPLMIAAARAVNLDDEAFMREHGKPVFMAGRFNFYPPCPNPETVLGVKSHADGSTFTLLLQDKEVGGLQVLKGDQWYRVPIIPEALFISTGDYMEMMSNGIIKSTVHRVVTNRDKERCSIASFLYPSTEREIGPIPELITEENPQQFKRVMDYESKYFDVYQANERPLDRMKL